MVKGGGESPRTIFFSSRKKLPVWEAGRPLLAQACSLCLVFTEVEAHPSKKIARAARTLCREKKCPCGFAPCA